MRAIILADNRSLNLRPLTDQMPYALLPVAGKPILRHLLEQLHRNGIRSVLVVSPSHHQALERIIDVGPLLGMEVKFNVELPDLRRINQRTLLLGIHQLVDHDWLKAIKKTALNTDNSSAVMMATTSSNIGLLLPANYADFVPDDWSQVNDQAIHKVQLDHTNVLTIDSLARYQHANFEFLRRSCCELPLRHFVPAGRMKTPGHFAAPKARISKDSLHANHSYIGAQSRVDHRARLTSSVVIGNDVFIDKGARIADSIILDGTYIGAMTSCYNAIVSGNLFIKVDTGLSVAIDDPVLISAAR